jgi:putative Mg2+ transporter-C (MgtC) family protein
MAIFIDSMIKLSVAVALGGIVGLEREISHKPAGLRTNILICMGSALCMIISHLVAQGVPGADPARIGAQVVVGIGFLGAGAIIQSRGSVVGLTTGATIFVVAAIGLAVGGGFWVPAVMGTAITLLSLIVLTRLEKIMQTKRSLFKYTLVAHHTVAVLDELDAVLDEYGLTMEEISYDRLDEDKLRLSFSVLVTADVSKQLRRRLIQLKSVTRVESPRHVE